VTGGSGDDETLTLSIEGNEAISEPWNVGTGAMVIRIDKYKTGSGSLSTIYYKTGSSKANCLADSWNSGTSFVSLGWIQVRLVK